MYAFYPRACAHIVRRCRKTLSGLYDTISNDFNDTTFLWSNTAKLQLCWTYMCRYILPQVTNWSCYKQAFIQVKIHELPRKEVK